MPQNTNSGAADINQYAQVTDADVTHITFQNQGEGDMHLTASNGTGTPANDAGHIVLHPGEQILNEALADLFPGITGANRVWVRGYGPYFVSHA